MTGGDVPATMRALVKATAGPGAELRECAVPVPGPGELLIQVEAASLCGTDLHIFRWDPWAEGRLGTGLPRIFGHEMAGRVVAHGPSLTGRGAIPIGTLVAAETHLVDGTCYQCRTGREHVCANLRILGVDIDGAFAEYVVLPAHNAWPSPGLEPEIAAIQEPMGNAVHAAFTEEIAGQTVAVLGCGPIGIMAVAIADLAGAAKVFATDINPERLEMAGRLGADVMIDAREDVVARLRDETGGVGVDVVLEMSGAEAAIRQGFEAVTNGGRVSLLGLPSRPITLDVSEEVIFKGIRIYGITGRQDVRDLVSHPGAPRPGARPVPDRDPPSAAESIRRSIRAPRRRPCRQGRTAAAGGMTPMATTARSDPLAFLADDVAELRRQNLYRPLRIMSSAQGPVVTIDGREVISLSSNDYLGLTHHPRLREAALRAVEAFGAGSGAVRTIAGTMSLHEELETSLAEFKGTEAVLTFQSGFTANTGVIPTITGDADLIVSDALNHASIIDGMRLSKAPRVVYDHADVGSLRARLEEARAKGRPDGTPHRLILIVTDGVFSMDGDIAPLAGIVEAAEEFGAAVMVDDAHASGVLGRNGRGSVDHFGLHGRVAIQVGTLSKAVGVLGGYVAGSTALREMLIQRARPFLFSTSHPPAVAAACIEAIRVFEDEPELIERLWASTRSFKAELARLGFDIGASETPITPVILGDSATTIRFSDRLFEEGVFGTSVVFPTVALDRARIRTIVTAAHSDDQLDQALAAFDRVGRELGVIAG